MATEDKPSVQKTEGAKDRLLRKVKQLDDLGCQVLETMVDSLGGRFEERLSPDSDIAIPAFAQNFRQRLQIHHATHEEAFKKKTFEFAFKASCIAAGKKATMDPNDSNPGYDVIVDGVKYSLKTEAGKSINNELITISKLMEARWIRDCQTGENFQHGMKHLHRHFSQYQRVLILRARRVATPFVGVEYQLVEIPLAIFFAVGDLTPEDFAPRGQKSGGSSAIVRYSGSDAFRLRLDGSVEKVTVSRLKKSLCKIHATWIVQMLLGGPSDEEE